MDQEYEDEDEERTRITPTFLAEPMTEMGTRMSVLDMVNLG